MLFGCILKFEINNINNKVKKMSKDLLFNLIHHLQKEQPHQNYFTNMLYLTNFIIHIIIYFSFPLYSLTNFPSIAKESTAIIFFLAFTFSLPIQMIMFLTKEREFYLRKQLLFFRFIVSPILTLRLIQNADSSAIQPSVTIVLIIFVRSFSYLLSKFILYENQRHYSLKVQQTSIIAKMQIVEITIIFNFFMKEQKSQFIFATFTLCFCYYLSYRYLNRMDNEEISYKILASINMMYLLMFTIYVGILMFGLIGGKISLSVFVPLLVVAGWSISKQRRIVKDNIVLLLSRKLTYNQFIQSADGFLMVLKQDAPLRKRTIANYIMAIFSAHEKSCDMPACEIQSPSTKQQLRSLSSKSIDQLAQKAIKKLEWIFQQYHHSNADNINITFALLKFYSQFMPNKAKMQNLLSDIEVQELGLALECEYSKYKKICTNIQNVENIDVIKDEDVYLEFRTTMISTLNSMIEFWNQFGEERVDLAKVTAITAKLFPLKGKIESIFRHELNKEKFTTFKILKLYSIYTRRILNRWQEAAKVQDFLQILAQRLKDKQDIQFLSKESEAGFVVICLSESKLGNIFMANQKACTLFRYAKKDILNLRVNAIMPTVIADIHDQILTDFLKKKRKSYNTDQRLLFGKDGNGFIFPLLLQLQRASFSANDEFIFIASVAPGKLKAAPNYCIIDQEGAIMDFTSTFHAIFFEKSRKNQQKNIQQIIPGYFQSDLNQQELKVRNFTFTINSKKLNGVQANGQSTPLIVKGVHEGFIIKIQYDYQRAKSTYKHICLSDNIKDLIMNKEARAFENIYQSSGNVFQIQGGKPHNFAGNVRRREFTLPFLNYEDMAIFAQPLPQKKDYGKGIKMVRYIKNHYERIDDEQSFHSDTYKDNHQETLKQIQNMQSARKKSQGGLLIRIRIIVGLGVVIAVIVMGFIYRRYQTLISDEEVIMEKYHRSNIIFVQLSEYIICFTCEQGNVYPDFFKEVKESLKSQLVNNINQAQLSEIYKQQMTRIVYLQTSSVLQQILKDSFKIGRDNMAIEGTFDGLWGGAIAITLIIMLIFPFMFCQIKSILFQIYLLFIDIKDPVIKKIDSNCRALIDKICLQIQQNVQKQQEKKEMDFDQEGELQKKRRFKNTERTKDLYLLIKIIVPILIIIALLFFALFFSRSKLATYEILREKQGKILEAVPLASIQYMRMNLKWLNNITLVVNNNYQASYQELQSTMLQFTQQMQGKNFLHLMYQDVCAQNIELLKQLGYECKTIGSGIMIHGISPTINLLSQILQYSRNTISAYYLKLLFVLQFFFINPTLLNIQQQMSQSIYSYLDSISLLFQSITILISCLLAIFYLYLIIYPLNAIQEEIAFTSEMITLVPERSGNFQGINKSVAISQNNL